MATLIDATPSTAGASLAERDTLIAAERHKCTMLRLWIGTGIFFMVLPGTILGFTNLLAISAHHGLEGLSPAWIQAHGHSQIFGWIGSFALGIGFYSQPRTGIRNGRLPIVCWSFWTAGLILHWLAAGYFWHWRVTLPFSGVLEFAAVLVFLRAARQHRLHKSAPADEKRPRTESRIGSRIVRHIEPWMQSVLVSNTALFLALVINLVLSFELSFRGTSPAIPHDLDQRYLVLVCWGFLAPLIWGFSARWLPIFLGVAPVRGRGLQLAVALAVLGVILGAAHITVAMALALAAATILAAVALRIFAVPRQPAKTIGLHRSFPVFLRIAYAWSLIASLLGVWASLADTHGGIWGGSRHALTVGFAAMMVMTVGPRILPHFAGVRSLWSPGLMFATLLSLLAGCTLRVSMEPLAYEGILPFAWRLLPLSGVLELTAVALFALQLVLTFALEPSIFADTESA